MPADEAERVLPGCGILVVRRFTVRVAAAARPSS
jgi:hypothetical protein